MAIFRDRWRITCKRRAAPAETVNRARAKAAPGGVMAALDPVAPGRVSLLDAGAGDAAQAVAAVDDLIRLSRGWTRTGPGGAAR